MQTVVVTIVCVVLMVFGGMTVSQGFVSSVGSTSGGWKEIEEDNDVNFDIDILVRKPDGTVRTTIATNS